MDMNADGRMDFIAAIYEGVVFFVEGSAKGWKEPRRITDSQGRNVVLSLYYDRENNEYKNANRAPKGQKDPGDHCVSASLFDWDGDGDLDLLLGAYKGALYRQMNEGKKGQPRFTGINIPVYAGNAPFKVKGGLTAARLVDWNSDGLTDLVCGGFEGGVSLYLNNGKPGAPSFAAPMPLIPEIKPEFMGPNTPTRGLYVDPIDYDGDGDLDLIIGGYAVQEPIKVTLTSAQQEDLARYTATREALTDELTADLKRVMEAHKDLPKKERAEKRNEYYATEKSKARSKHLSSLYQKISKLSPRSRRASGIWLYRRK